MSKQAVEHDGKIMIVDTETERYSEAKPEPAWTPMSPIIDAIGSVVGGAADAAADAVDDIVFKK